MTHAEKKICTIYREDTLKNWMCQKWFVEFDSEDFLLNDQRDQVKFESNQMKTLLENHVI